MVKGHAISGSGWGKHTRSASGRCREHDSKRSGKTEVELKTTSLKKCVPSFRVRFRGSGARADRHGWRTMSVNPMVTSARGARPGSDSLAVSVPANATSNEEAVGTKERVIVSVGSTFQSEARAGETAWHVGFERDVVLRVSYQCPPARTRLPRWRAARTPLLPGRRFPSPARTPESTRSRFPREAKEAHLRPHQGPRNRSKHPSAVRCARPRV